MVTSSTFHKAPPVREYVAMESLNIARLPYLTATNCTTSTIAAETPAYFTTHANEQDSLPPEKLLSFYDLLHVISYP